MMQGGCRHTADLIVSSFQADFLATAMHDCVACFRYSEGSTGDLREIDGANIVG